MSLFHRRLLVALRTLVLFAAAATPGFAQDDRDALAKELLDVEVMLSGAYDSEGSTQGVASGGVPQIQPPGYSAWGVGSLYYTRLFSEGQFGAAASSSVRHYPGVQDFTSATHTGIVNFNTSLPARLGLQVNQLGSYSPAFLYGMFPTLPTSSADPALTIPPGYDYDLDASSSYYSRTTVGLSRTLNFRTSLGVEGRFEHTNFASETDLRRDLTTYSISARFRRNLNRNNRLSIGYRFESGNYNYRLTADHQSTDQNAVDIGLDFDRPVSALDRVSFFVRVGASSVTLPEFLPGVDLETPGVDARTVNVTGEGGLVFPFARGWQLRASVNRGLQYVAGVSQPLFVNGFSGELNGALGRRVGVIASVRRTSGQSVFTGSGLLDTYTGRARLGVALTRRLEAYAEYLYYGYDTGGVDIEPGVPVLPGAPLDLERHSARVGLVLRVPAFRR
jgi:hypothetical protein